MHIYGPGTKLKDGDVEIEIGTLCQRKDERELDLSSGDRFLRGKTFLRMEKRQEGDDESTRRIALITQCGIAYIWVMDNFNDLKIIGDINNMFNSPILSGKDDCGGRGDDWPKVTITTKKGSTSFTHIDRKLK